MRTATPLVTSHRLVGQLGHVGGDLHALGPWGLVRHVRVGAERRPLRLVSPHSAVLLASGGYERAAAALGLAGAGATPRLLADCRSRSGATSTASPRGRGEQAARATRVTRAPSRCRRAPPIGHALVADARPRSAPRGSKQPGPELARSRPWRSASTGGPMKQSSSAWVGCSCTVAGVDHPATFGQRALGRGAGRASGATIIGVVPMPQRFDGVAAGLSALFHRRRSTPRAASTSRPTVVWPAVSNESRVRVDSSKNSVATTRPRRVGTFRMARRSPQRTPRDTQDLGCRRGENRRWTTVRPIEAAVRGSTPARGRCRSPVLQEPISTPPRDVDLSSRRVGRFLADEVGPDGKLAMARSTMTASCTARARPKVAQVR